MEQIIVEMSSTATIAIAVFGIVFCLTQTKYARVSRSFAAFLTAVAANNVPTAFARIAETLPTAYTESLELVIWSPSSLLLSPLFWIYVYALTSPTQRRPLHLRRHLMLPALAVLVGLVIAVFQQDMWGALVLGEPLPDSVWPITLVTAFLLLHFAVYPQMAFYLFLIIRRLMRHRLMLRDVYASTEEHELRWIYVIGGLGGLFWLAAAFSLVTEVKPLQATAQSMLVNIGSISGLALIATTTLWGLRQRPPLVPDIEEQHAITITDKTPKNPAEKYEKSALTSEASARITRKLRTAMEADHLHRDPNISLWALARHIGASPNYISQTLNEVIGESFFDFINGYRIAEAKTLLSTTNDTVLTITYDVGFNARSSFYNAFKRVTGQTPTGYRKTLSKRDGTDDNTG